VEEAPTVILQEIYSTVVPPEEEEIPKYLAEQMSSPKLLFYGMADEFLRKQKILC
jgi:hypothetical protein